MADAIGTRPRRRFLVFTLVRSYARVPALVLVLMLSGVPSVIAGASATAGEDDPPSIASPPGSSALRGDPSGKSPAPSPTSSTPNSSGDWLSQAGQSIEASEYQVTRLQGVAAGDAEADLQAPNRAQGFRTYFGGDRVRLVPRRETDPEWELGLSLLGYGRGADVRPVAPASPHPLGARVDYARSGLAEWYVNDPRGLEQGFTLSGPPEMLPLPPRPPVLHTPGARRGPGDLDGLAPAFLVIELTGNLAAQLDAEGKAIDFAPPSGGPAVVRLADLEVRDALGSELPAWMEGFHEAGVRGVRLVWDDRGAVYPVVVDPLATSASWTAEGDLDGAHLGWSVAPAGDVNGDGYDDVIVGAPHFDAIKNDQGRVYVFHGSPSGLSATPAWFADGQSEFDRFGHAVAAVGDLNGDGYGEVMVGAPGHGLGDQPSQGRVYIYYGTMSGLEDVARWWAGATAGDPKEGFGYSVASAGDVNGDDYLDVIVGAPDYDAGGDGSVEGRAYVFQGRNDTVTGLQDCSLPCAPNDAVWKLDGAQTDARFGHSVAGAGDFHADSYDEVIIGAPYYDNGQSNEGSAFVYRGSSTGFLPTPYVLEPDLEKANFGWSVSAAGDVNNDTHPDVVVGAPGWATGPSETDDGRVFVYHGGAPPDSTADWTHELANTGLGCAVAAAGDVDGDGVGDLLVGAKGFEDDAPEQGAALLFYGSSGDGLGPAWAWRVLGSQYRSDVGHAVAGAGDVNGDGLDDLIVGAPRYYRGEAEEGRALVFHGAVGITNSGLNQQLGLDPGLVTHTEWGVLSGTTPLDTRTEAPDAVAYGSLPGSVLLTTGRASDEGLGDTDWADDGLSDTTWLDINLNVPPAKMTLCFTAQFVTAESDALTDQASFQFSHDGVHGPSSDVYVVSEHATSEKNPPASYCIDVCDKNYVHLKFEVEDGGGSGSHDSGLIVSRFHYSNIPLPADLRNPDDIDDDGCFHNPAPHDVSAAAGTYSYSKPLIEVPGVSMPFNFAVRYSSGATKDDVVGQGWSHSYLGVAWKTKDDDGTGYPDRIIARPGGGASYFKEKESSPGVYVYEPQHGGECSSLTLNADETIDYTTKNHHVHHFGEMVHSRKYLLSWIEDANGNRLTFSYDADNRLEQVTDTRGGSENTFVFDYGSSGSDRLQSVTFDWTDSLGQSRQSRVDFEYDTATGYLSSLADLNGEATTFTYTRDGRLLAATDADGITFVGNTYEEYQGLGLDQDGYRLYSQRDGRDPDPFDAEEGVSYAYEGELLVLADRLDRQQTTAHDARGRRAWTINAMGVFEEYTYDRNNNPVEIRRKLPSESESRIVQSGVFDEAANPVEQVRFPDTCAGGANQGEECSEDADCPLSSCGVSGTMAYDLRHNLISLTDHYGNTTTLDYDANNNLLRERDPLGHEMSHVYATVPGGASVHPGPISTTDARGNLFRAEYDLRGYLTAAIGPLGGRTEHAYNDLGHRISTVDPEGHRICFEHDDGGRLIAETAYCDTCYGGSNHDGDCTSDGDCPGGTCGLTSTMTYDAKGNQLTRVDPDGATTTTEYTPTGQTAREIDALGHSLSYEYDAGDRLSAILVNNPAERAYGTTCPLVTAHVHDDGDHLTAASVYVPDGAQCADATPALAEALAEYDEIGNRTSLTDPNGHVTTYTYDLLQRLASETDGLGTVSFTYDARDLMTSRMTAVGDTIQYTYDARGLLTRVDFPGDGISHVLDANGNRVSSERDSAAGPVTRTFDALDRMVSRTDEYGHTVGYEYDLAGNLTRLVYPSGVEVLYEYDGLNRLKAVCDWNCDPDQCKAVPDDCTAVYAYDVAGNLTGARLPDGATVDYSYDAARRPIGVDDSLGTQTYYRATYTLNAAGKRIAADLELPLEPDPDTGRTDFAYGAANTLTGRSGAVGTASYEYDADGNMLTGTLGGAARTISYNALGQLESYDATFYRYDADGLRVETALGDKVRRHAYDVTSGHARLLEERDGQGNLVARYVYGIGLLARDGPEGPRIYHYDSRGSTVALTDGAGTVTDRYAYGPYGQLLGSVADVDLDGDGNPDPTENPFTYAGRDGVQNDGNGLYYMRARYYAPELGRFIQKDRVFDGSLSVPQSLNRYSYVEGDPVLLTDPNGDFIFTLIATIVVTAVIAASINVAVECADGDGCDAEEVFETIGTSIVESIPVVGTVYHGVTMGMSGEWDWLTFGTSVVSDVATFATLGAGASASAGYEAFRGVNRAAAQFAKTGSKTAGKQVSNLLRGFDKARKAHKAFKTAENMAKAARRVGRGARMIRMIFGGSDSGGAGGPAASTGPDASGTATDSLNPVACPQPGGTESTGFCGVKCEVWR